MTATVDTAIATSGYVSLGAGPQRLALAAGLGAQYQIADSQPSASSTGIALTNDGLDVQTASQIWVIALFEAAVVVSAPITPVSASGATNATAPGVATLVGGEDSTGKLQPVTAAVFHNADNQSIASNANGLLTGGVAQVLNFGGNLDRAREAYGDAMPVTGIPAGVSYLWNGVAGSYDRPRSAVGDAQASTGIAAEAPMLFNGLTYDREHNGWNAAIADAGVKTASFSGATQTNFDAEGVVVILTIGTVSGTSPTLGVQLQFGDGNGNWVNAPGAAISIAASGSYLLCCHPEVTSQTGVASLPLPRFWRLNYTIGGTSPSFTIASVEACYAK